MMLSQCSYTFVIPVWFMALTSIMFFAVVITSIIGTHYKIKLLRLELATLKKRRNNL